MQVVPVVLNARQGDFFQRRMQHLRIVIQTKFMQLLARLLGIRLTIFQTDDPPALIELTAARQHQRGQAAAALDNQLRLVPQTILDDELDKISGS